MAFLIAFLNLATTKATLIVEVQTGNVDKQRIKMIRHYLIFHYDPMHSFQMMT